MSMEGLDESCNNQLFHPDENHEFGIRQQAAGIKMMISHIAKRKRTLIYLHLNLLYFAFLA